MNTEKLVLNIASTMALVFIFVFMALFFSVQLGVMSLEPESVSDGPENISGVPIVLASNNAEMDGEQLEMALYEEVNERRVTAGEQELVHSERVRLIARLHSKDMADRNYFDHKNPEGQGSGERHAEYNGCESTNENIAKFWMVTNETYEMAEVIVDAWSDSTAHNSLMLTDYRPVTGVGVHVTADGIIYATQNFCREHPSA